MADGYVETHKPKVLLVKPSSLSTPQERALAQKYQDYLLPLSNEEFPCSKKAQAKVISQVSRERGDSEKNIPSTSTLYKWFKKYTSNEINRNIAAMVSIKTKKEDVKQVSLRLIYSMKSSTNTTLNQKLKA
eukprot:TRINITY_DN5687_c0_g1_i1.p1 TRINITY_DN5687_c0_g1~~TRINITY_DN5687_c0_g1_i1.p1  ORF type:complete len:131 (+),score=5.01 TRINITY_DN5687_c0_g1_i1:125-517(+)